MFKNRLPLHSGFTHTNAPANSRVEHDLPAKSLLKHLVNLAVEDRRLVIVSEKNAGQTKVRVVSLLDLRNSTHQQFKPLQVVAGRKHWNDEPVSCNQSRDHQKIETRWSIDND